MSSRFDKSTKKGHNTLEMKLFPDEESGTTSPCGTMSPQAPLADRMRPGKISEYVGQAHILGMDGILRRLLRQERLFSIILWGPPGSGKTTLARLVAQETGACFETFSAVLSGVKEIRTVIDRAKERLRYGDGQTILFVDEIHRFNKAQQDAFLPYVEEGLITLMGATTENPSFEIIAPLLSRVRVLVLNPLSIEDLAEIMKRALDDSERGLGGRGLSLDPQALDYLARSSDGDARSALNSLETAAALVAEDPASRGCITLAVAEKALQRRSLRYDKTGEEHYNLISAFHKSLRSSDPDGALYWLARMLDSGEHPLYIARRMVRFASEDVGLADPTALPVSLAAMEAFRFLGLPEADLALAEAAVYLATAPKSNALYRAMGNVRQTIEKTGSLPVPMDVRNAPTKLMKDLGYGTGYKYAHDYPHGQVHQASLPDELRGSTFYSPTDRGYEARIRERLRLWKTIRDRTEASPDEKRDTSRNDT
ncbi:MAG: replication-associated recombination protein A [Syntrophales bacterium]|nr:replication-associated recombination protein A [Syntrophales bacterium]MCK9528495.1 replication-associated recombination protein A [Syntrophales bacterium]MDX9923032.1 replication-associated recombination protein A [Syntrophales bacterium]